MYFGSFSLLSEMGIMVWTFVACRNVSWNLYFKLEILYEKILRLFQESMLHVHLYVLSFDFILVHNEHI